MKKTVFSILLFFINISICFGTEPNLVAHYKFDTLTYAVSGTLVPNAAGAYLYDGTYDGHICYKSVNASVFRGLLKTYYVLWWHYWDEVTETYIDYWAVAFTRNANDSIWYKPAASGIWGDYQPVPGQSGVTGVLHFSAVVADEKEHNGSYLSSEPNVFGSLIAGKIGNALNFDSTKNNYVDTLDVNSTLQKDFSISIWLEATDGHPVTNENIWGTVMGSVALNRCNLTLLPNGKLQFFYIANVIIYDSLVSPVLLADGQETWHHVVCVVKQSSDVNITSYIYFDGVLKVEKDTSNIMSTYQNSLNLFVGNTNSAGMPEAESYFDGVIDDVRIYDKALTATEIIRLYWGLAINDANFIDPNNVRLGESYKISDVNLTGMLDLPDINDVRYGTSFDGETKTGTYKGKRRMRWW